MKSKILTFIILITFKSISFAQNQRIKEIFVPKIDEIAICSLGNPILNMELLNTNEGAELLESIEVNFLDAKVILPPCDLEFVKNDKKYKIYRTQKNNLYTRQLLTGVVYKRGLLKVNKNTMEVKKITFEGSMNYLNIKYQNPPILIPKDIFSIEKPSLKKEFIYNGKAGQILKFTYREFNNDFSRPAFTQDVQYDLSEGNKIAFKSFQAEIISASNLEIKYKILSGF
jgi:hypothetical protein